MSRSRLEKDPYRQCGYSWPGEPDALVDCPHICRELIIDHPDEHFCCGSTGGVLPVDDVVG